jgi:hypothetical protein
VRGVTVVLKTDLQFSPAEVQAVQLAAIDVENREVRLRNREPEVDDAPEEPALWRGFSTAGRQVDQASTDAGAARVRPRRDQIADPATHALAVPRRRAGERFVE